MMLLSKGSMPKKSILWHRLLRKERAFILRSTGKETGGKALKSPQSRDQGEI